MECKVRGCKFIQDTSWMSIIEQTQMMQLHMQFHIVELLQKLLIKNGGKPY